jgi:hypothetical protein
MNPYPLNRKALGEAIQGWLVAAEPGPEVDAKLTLSLREIGMLSIADEVFFEPGSREHGLLHIFHTHGVLQVETDGTVTIF